MVVESNRLAHTEMIDFRLEDTKAAVSMSFCTGEKGDIETARFAPKELWLRTIKRHGHRQEVNQTSKHDFEMIDCGV